MCSTFPIGNIDETACIVVKDEIVIWVSQQFAELTEYSKDELSNKNIIEVFSTLRVGPDVNLEIIDRDTDYFLFTKGLEARFAYIEVIEEDNKQIYIFIEKPFSRLEDKFSYLEVLISENIKGISIFSIPDFTLLTASQMALNIFNAPYNSAENAFGKTIYKLALSWKGSYLDKVWKDIIETGKPRFVKEYKYDKLKKGITYLDVTLTPLKENGKVRYLVIDSEEVTERVLYRQQLEGKNRAKEEHNELLEAVIENIDDAIFIFDKDNNYYMQNKAARDYFPRVKLNQFGDGYANSEYFDLDGNKMSSEDMTIAKVQKGQVVKDHRIKMVQGDNIRYISVSGRPLFNPDNKIKLSILHSRDITEEVNRKQIIEEQKELIIKREVEKNEALEKAIEMKDEFLSLISHELRTPLNVINAAVQAINSFSNEELSEKTRQYIAMIRKNSIRQLRLVNNLLDITRAQAGRITANKRNVDIVFLTGAITKSVYSFALRKNINLTFKAAFEKKIIVTDDEKYERILLNLLSNAIKFTPRGKSIKVEISRFKGSVCIKVKDEGIGIPEDKIDLIFERFGQVDSSLSRQAEGAGIGLPLVKKFVETLGGEISVKSKVNKGSTFTILLPDEAMVEEINEKLEINFMDNHLVQIANEEFSDIYL